MMDEEFIIHIGSNWRNAVGQGFTKLQVLHVAVFIVKDKDMKGWSSKRKRSGLLMSN